MNDGTLNEGEHQKEVAVFEIRYDVIFTRYV